MKATKHLSVILLFVFILISYIQHSRYINLDIQGIHTWRQTQTMWNVRNFVRHDNNIFNPRTNRFNGGKGNILRYEFPIMRWTVAQFQKLFGEDISVIRNSIFIMGLLSIMCVFGIVQLMFKDWITSFITAVLFQYSPVFYFYTINPLPDNLALCGGLFYLYFILKHRGSNKSIHLIAAGISLLIATLSKLPYLMFSIVSILFFVEKIISNKKISMGSVKEALIQLLIISPAVAWYVWVIPTWSGNPVLTGKLDEKFVWSEYLNIAEYHAKVMFPELLLSMPVWILIAVGFLKIWKYKKKLRWLFGLMIITFCYLFFEFKPIGTVHDYYMMPFLPWLFFVIGVGVYTVNRFSYGKFFLLAICIWSAVHTSKVTDYMWSIESIGFNRDVFIYSEELKNAVPDNEHCIILNDDSGYAFSYRIDKMGYVFSNDHLPVGWIDDLIKNHGVEYMYSDSKKINESEEFQKFIKRVVIEKGSIKVFQLKLPD